MQTPLLFFLPSHHHTNKTTPISVTIFMPDTFQRHNCQVHIHHRYIVFQLPQLQGVFTVNPKCKMTVKYGTPESNTLEKISLHVDQHQMVIQCQQTLTLNTVYERLKLLISHRGFNQYFKPVKRLGKGAFATVYLIEHKYSKKRWAAKVFSREGQKLQFKGQQALQNQIRTLKYLSHPNIIQYQGIYETDNLIYLVTEYLSGGTLQQYMKNKSQLNGKTIQTIISQMLTTLQYLQDNHVMHRDLKPQNILLRESDAKWVLADFGLSAFVNQNHIFDKCGTMGYMAPEILSENKEERAFVSACDLYSLGVIAYNLILGSLPFKVQTEGIFDRKIVWDAWKRPQCQELHPQVITFLKGLLQFNPKKRLSASKATESEFLCNKAVISSWEQFNKKKMDERFQKILKMANIN